MSSESKVPHIRRRAAIFGAAATLLAAVIIIVVVVAMGGSTAKHHRYNERASYNAGYSEGAKLAKYPANIVMVLHGFADSISICHSYDHLAAKTLDRSRWDKGCSDGFVYVSNK